MTVDRNQLRLEKLQVLVDQLHAEAEKDRDRARALTDVNSELSQFFNGVALGLSVAAEKIDAIL